MRIPIDIQLLIEKEPRFTSPYLAITVFGKMGDGGIWMVSTTVYPASDYNYLEIEDILKGTGFNFSYYAFDGYADIGLRKATKAEMIEAVSGLED